MNPFQKCTLFLVSIFCVGMLAGCGETASSAASSTVSESLPASVSNTEEAAQSSLEVQAAVLPDGLYTARFDTDSGMFHVNEACDGRGTLTVQNGSMTLHVSLTSKKIINLFPGMAEQAELDGAAVLEPTLDTVTYPDGLSEEVYGFDIPVTVLDEEFDLALLGTKGTWYDHKVIVSDPQPLDNQPVTAAQLGLADGIYTCEVTLEGGSGRSGIETPSLLTVENGAVTLTLVWNSPNYDYMLVNGEKYLPVNTQGNSVFEIPAAGFDAPLAVVGDTIAMSTPHEVEYTILLSSDTLAPEA
ncbi:MAG: iron transporter [Faecalibacterium sp.]